MTDRAQENETQRDGPRRWQFSLKTLLVLITDAAIVLAMYQWMGGDGSLLAGLIVPTLTVFLIGQGGFRHKAWVSLIATMMTIGGLFMVLSPDFGGFSRSDDAAGTSLVIGLIGGALCLTVLRRKGLALQILSVALLWSVLLNVTLLVCLMLVLRFATQSPQPLPVPGTAPTTQREANAATSGSSPESEKAALSTQ